MKYGRTLSALSLLALCLLCIGCGGSAGVPETAPPAEEAGPSPAADPAPNADVTAANEKESEDFIMQMKIGETAVAVEWEDNASVDALKELCADGPLTVACSMYGGFEQVGSLGASMPRNDVPTVTEAGDIVLYSGNQIVVFYGSNSWSYTRLGRVTDRTAAEMADLLGNGDTSLTLYR